MVRPLRRLIAPAVTRRTVPFSGSYGRASSFPGCTMWLATINGPSVTPRGTHSFSYYESDALHIVRVRVGKLRARCDSAASAAAARVASDIHYYRRAAGSQCTRRAGCRANARRGWDCLVTTEYGG